MESPPPRGRDHPTRAVPSGTDIRVPGTNASLYRAATARISPFTIAGERRGGEHEERRQDGDRSRTNDARTKGGVFSAAEGTDHARRDIGAVLLRGGTERPRHPRGDQAR